MYTPNEVKHIILNYKWKCNLINDKVYSYDTSVTAAYGIESSLPKAQGETSDKVLVRVIKNDKHDKILKSLIEEVSFIDRYEECITNDKNFHLLQMLKNGHSKAKIKSTLEIGNDTLEKRLNAIVNIYVAEQIKEYQLQES